MKYLVDANVFIEGKNRYYGFDIAPGFWEWLHREHEGGNVFTVQKVEQEIKQGQDELADWFKGRPKSFVMSSGSLELAHLADLATWANGGHYTPAAVHQFLASADYYLIAQAKANDATVVTHEVGSPLSGKRIKIPDAADAIGVACVSPFEMMRDLRARLVCR